MYSFLSYTATHCKKKKVYCSTLEVAAAQQETFLNNYVTAILLKFVSAGNFKILE